jgi:signal transduction histidine kinase
MSICDIEAIEGPEDVIRHIQQLKKMGYTRFESRHKCKDGKIIDVEVSSNYLDMREGQIFSFLRDITERKRIEEELDKYRDHLEELVEKRTAKLTDANEQLQIQMEQRIEFTRALVHELKTPLTPIRIASELLISTLQEEPWLSCAKKINKGALNLSRRIDDLLDLARSEMGILKLEYESVDLNQMLSEVADYMVEEANKIGLSLTLDLPPFLSPLRCDRERLQQVVLNLLDNAFKFTPNGGRITLKARQRNSTITVEVQDTGPVIAKEEQKRLFQPYHRLERDRKHLSGLGLGLAICKVLVELHEGQIWLESQYGKGNSFVFTIPIKSFEPE